MKKTKIKKDLFNRIKEIGSENKVRGITLISLVITRYHNNSATNTCRNNNCSINRESNK